MSVQAWTFVMVGLSFALYIGVAIWSRAMAIWSRASSTEEFYIAGAGVPSVVNGMATAADWMSAASFISMAGLIYFVHGTRWFRLSHGLDRRLCIIGITASTVSAEVR